MEKQPYIPGAFWIDRLDVDGEMVCIEAENVAIAGVTARLSNEDRDHFSPQIPDKFKRSGYNYRTE